MIEYILILVLTVAIIMALSKGVGRPLQSYLKNNVLNIISCMLRVGQFPTKSFGLCTEAAKVKFDFKGSFTGTTGSGGKGSSTPGDNNGGDADDGSKDGKNGSNANNSEAGGSKKGSKFRPSSSSGALNENDSDPFGDSATQKIKIRTTDLGSGKSGELAMTGFEDLDGQTIIIRRIHKNNRIGGSFFVSDDSASKEEADGKAFAQTSTKKALPLSLLEDSNVESSFSIPKAKSRGPADADLNVDVEFSFFGFLKWGIIIAVLVIFGFFTLSQLNSIRKGWTD